MIEPQPPAAEPAGARAAQIVAAARSVLEEHGWEAVSMRTVADRLGIRAPSLYKHVSGKDALHAALVAAGLREMGAALHAALSPDPAAGEAAAGVGRPHPGSERIAPLLQAYRRQALANRPLYRLATSGPLDRGALPKGLEEWAGHPFYLVTGDAVRAQALWAAAHGLAILEVDDRYPPGSPLDEIWAATALAWSR